MLQLPQCRRPIEAAESRRKLHEQPQSWFLEMQRTPLAFTTKVSESPGGVDDDGDAPPLWVLRDVLGTRPQTRKSERVRNAQ
jgi:hypothetical protein